MAEDNRFLPFFLREPIYVVAEPERVAEELRVPLLSASGLDTKGVLILVHETEHSLLAPADQTLLEKILQAVNLSTDDVALVNWHSAQSSLEASNALDQHLPNQPYQTNIVFGEVPTPWSLSNFFEMYTVSHHGTRRFLRADPLKVLRENSEQKLRLWKCLQQVFL